MTRKNLPIATSVDDPRVLLFSLRNTGRKDLFRCAHYEFEDVICDIESVEMVAPEADQKSMRNEVAERLAFRAPILLKPKIEECKIRNHYDLFFAICGFSRDLLTLHATRDLWKACSIKVCLIDELWVNQIKQHRFFLEVLKEFDLVVLYYSQTVAPLSERIGGNAFLSRRGLMRCVSVHAWRTREKCRCLQCWPPIRNHTSGNSTDGRKTQPAVSS